MIISVTRKHIQEGNPRIAHQCPIALAILSQYSLNARVTVGAWNSNYICINSIVYYMPRSVSRFIKNIDNDKYPRKNLKPFNFKLVRRIY